MFDERIQHRHVMAAYVTMKGVAQPLPDDEAQRFWSDSLEKYYAHDRKGFTACKQKGQRC